MAKWVFRPLLRLPGYLKYSQNAYNFDGFLMIFLEIPGILLDVDIFSYLRKLLNSSEIL